MEINFTKCCELEIKLKFYNLLSFLYFSGRTLDNTTNLLIHNLSEDMILKRIKNFPNL